MHLTQPQADWFAETFKKLIDTVGGVVLGKEDIITLAFVTMLAEGHLLLEDAPGTGKTQLAKSMAATVQGTHKRIQFTPDLLPSDVTGVTVYDQQKNEFSFHKGAVFASILLADEINRASPKTQSALLEVMEEGRVTAEGESHSVERPFMVIATQNPIEQAGTYRLPEAQLDRFLMKTSIGYPGIAQTIDILAGSANRDVSSRIQPVITTNAIAEMIDLAGTVHVAPAVLQYIAELAEHTRNNKDARLGVSVRGAMALTRAVKARAASRGRTFVLPDDVEALAAPVWAHRVVMDPEAEFNGVGGDAVVAKAVSEVHAPQDREASA